MVCILFSQHIAASSQQVLRITQQWTGMSNAFTRRRESVGGEQHNLPQWKLWM